jgi:type IV pilus assembly protein PilB
MELVTEGQIQEALQRQRSSGGSIGNILVEMEIISQEELLLALSAQSGMEVIDLDELEIPGEVISKVKAEMASVFKVIPVELDSGVLTVAMADPNNVSVLDDLRFMLGCEVQGAVSTEEAVDRALVKYYAQKAETVDDLLGSIDEIDLDGADGFELVDESAIAIDNPESMASSPPVVKLVNLILLQAVKAQASDVHFEPFQDAFRVRYRVDGVLYEMKAPPLNLATAIISRIKVMSNLDISETRMPQDGRIMLSIGGKPVDLRVSTLPTMFGESCVMRVLDRSVVSLDLDNLGLRDEDLRMIKNLVGLPNGIIIVTGPTGSGKTTTLYSALNYANEPEVKIITTEDPVEYDLDGIVQCPVAEDIDVTYANLLRAILRQDPDMILVGEIRDKETAQIAIEASLTGHVVFSTLHTNDAPSAITRILDLGIENFLITATLEAIIAQRLVRKICRDCKVQYEPDEEVIFELNLKPEELAGKVFYRGTGCETCANSGYKGRLAIYEIMILTDRIKEMIMDNKSTDEIRRTAREQGMRTLRESGLLALFDGHSTIEEVVKETLFV